MSAKKILFILFLLTHSSVIFSQTKLEPVSRVFWGSSNAHFATNDKVFIAAGGAIIIGEITSANSIQVLNHFYLPTIVQDVHVQNNILYAIDLHEGLFIYEISNINFPNLISQLNFSSKCYDFIVDSGFVFVALDVNGIKKINVSNPSNPLIEVESPVQTLSLQKFNSYLYCMNELWPDNSIKILNSSTLQQAGSFAVDDYAFLGGIYFNDTKGFIIENYFMPNNIESSWGVLTALNMTNPANPLRADDLTFNGSIQSLSAKGDTLFVSRNIDLMAVNAANINNIVVLSQNPVLFSNSSLTQTSIDYPFLLLSYDYFAGFLIVDIQDIMNPIQGIFLDTSSKIAAVSASGPAVVAGRFEGNGLYLVDASDINKPIVKQRYTTDIGNVRDLIIRDSLVYAATNKLKIFEIKDLDSLSLISELNYGYPASLIDIDDTLIAVGGGYNGLHLVNVSNPSNPEYIANIQLPASGFNLENLIIRNNLVFASDYQRNGPLIYNINNPYFPTLVWTGTFRVNSFFLSESDTILFIGTANTNRVHLLNITNPSIPLELTNFNIPLNSYRIEDIYVSNNLLFLLCFNQNLYDSYLLVYDISDFQNIIQIAYAYLPDWALDVFVDGQYIYVSEFKDGVYIFDFGVIPVELISFTATISGSTVQLDWATASEKNNLGFEIQKIQLRYPDLSEVSWKKIGFVEGNGTLTEPNSYSFIDEGVNSGKYKYRLKQIDLDGSSTYSNEIEVEINNNPTEFALYQNYPNPFNPATKIKFSIPVVGTSLMNFVELKIFDVLGSEVAALVNEYKPAGRYEIIFDASTLSSGIYFYTLQAGSFRETKKMVLIR